MTTRIKAPKQARDGQDVAAEMVAESSVPHVQYTEAELQLAEAARTIAMDRDVLYHGTRYPRLVLETGALLRPIAGDKKVSLTRSPEVAAHFALLERDDDEGHGAILVLNRRSLQSEYSLHSILEPYLESNELFHDEAEEEIWEDVFHVHKHLLGVVYSSKSRGKVFWNRRQRPALHRRYKTQVKAKLATLVAAAPVAADR